MAEIDKDPASCPTDCECDSGHDHAGTVCRWCWAHGRRNPSSKGVVCGGSYSWNYDHAS